MARLTSAFYRRDDVVVIARELLGKHLFTRLNGRLSGGIIVETEAYAGPEDRASHAWNNRRTARTEVMFRAGGVAYVYLCYGMHHCFNVVTNVEGVPHAVLVRAVAPTHGLKPMLERRGKTHAERDLTAGPARTARALGITTALSGESLEGRRIWLETRGTAPANRDVVAAPRVGVHYAGSCATRPWRFYLAGSPYVSKR